MINIDLYNDDLKIKDCDGLKIFFNDLGAYYWGYVYKNNDVIGDFNCNNTNEIEKAFSHLKIDWDI